MSDTSAVHQRAVGPESRVRRFTARSSVRGLSLLATGALGVAPSAVSRLRPVVRLVLSVAILAGCGGATMPTPAPTTWGDRVPGPDPAAVASQPVVGRWFGEITLLPISPTGAVIGVPYAYEMPHCGINSPIDVDGSFWDPITVPQDPVAFDGVTGTFRLLSEIEATFVREDGLTLRLVRHAGAKAFAGCA